MKVQKEESMLKNTNINKVEISHVLFNKVTLLTLTRRPSGHGTINSQEIFLERFGPYICKMLRNKKLSAKIFQKGLDHTYTKCLPKDEFLMTLMKLRLHFLFIDLSQQFEIYLVAFVHDFLIYVMDMGLIYLKSSVT